MALTTLTDVKINVEYDYIEAAAPTVAENTAAGYTTGESWLDTTTGFSYECTDADTGTWVRIEKAIDAKINYKLSAFETMVFDWLGTRFPIARSVPFTGDLYGSFSRNQELFFLRYETVFSEYVVTTAGGLITPVDSQEWYGDFTNWAAGDKILITGSQKNNGFFTVATVNSTTGAITVDETLTDEAVSQFFITRCSVPDIVTDGIGSLMWFDTFVRDGAFGLRSEKIGTYSYTKDETTVVGNIGYPSDLVAPLMQYKNVVVGGNPITIGGVDSYEY